MKLLLDTNVCIDILRGNPNVVKKLSNHHPENCFLSTVTEFELLQGAARAPENFRQSEHAKVTRFVSNFKILPFNRSSACHAATINAHLLNQGNPISLADVFIAATALAHQLTLITNNSRDFKRISHLTIQDWR